MKSREGLPSARALCYTDAVSALSQSGRWWLAGAVALLGLLPVGGAATPWLWAGATTLGLVGAVVAGSGPWRRRALATAGLAGFGFMVWFVLNVAARNVITAGELAIEKQAVSFLRTVLWAQDKHVELHGRAGTLDELTRDGTLLGPEFRPQANGYGVVGAYAYDIFVSNDAERPADFLAYAWPVEAGRGGGRMFCVDRHENLMMRDARPQPQALERPSSTACLAPGAAVGDRPLGGVGADGAVWSRWKGRETRRAKGGT